MIQLMARSSPVGTGLDADTLRVAGRVHDHHKPFVHGVATLRMNQLLPTLAQELVVGRVEPLVQVISTVDYDVVAEHFCKAMLVTGYDRVDQLLGVVQYVGTNREVWTAMFQPDGSRRWGVVWEVDIAGIALVCVVRTAMAKSAELQVLWEYIGHCTVGIFVDVRFAWIMHGI